MFQFTYLLSSIIILLVDSVYLNTFSSYYNNQVKLVQNSPIKLNILGVGLSYLFIIIIFNLFVLGYNMTLYESFLLGFLIYGIYEATNLAIFKKWSIMSVFIDTLWGGLLFLIVNFIMKQIKKFKFKL